MRKSHFALREFDALERKLRHIGRESVLADQAFGYIHVLPFETREERLYVGEWLARYDHSDELRQQGPSGIRNYILKEMWDSVQEDPHAAIPYAGMATRLNLPVEDVATALHFWRVEGFLSIKGSQGNYSHCFTNSAKNKLSEGFDVAVPAVAEPAETDTKLVSQAPNPSDKNIFIGHGGSDLYMKVIARLATRYKVECVPFESAKVIGKEVIPTLKGLLDRCPIAVLVATAEDTTASGGKRARQNVVHEVGLWQGRHGFENVAVLLERPAESLSNLSGFVVAEFDAGKIEDTFHDLEDFMRHHGFERN